MLSTRDPNEMTEAERLAETARILAIGFLRLSARPKITSGDLSEPPKSDQDSLESSPESRLSVLTG